MKLRINKNLFLCASHFKVPFGNTFPTLKKIDFKINLVLDVPEGA